MCVYSTKINFQYVYMCFLLMLMFRYVRVKIFRFLGEKNRFVDDTSVVCLFRILCYPPFRSFLHSCVLSLGVVCWLEICIRELIFNMFISVFSSNVDVPLCKGEIFQVSRGQEMIRRRYFCCMFISYSLLSSFFALFVVLVCYHWVLFIDCIYGSIDLFVCFRASRCVF